MLPVTKSIGFTTLYKRPQLNTFEKIYFENYQAVYRVAKKMIGDGDDVSDIVQEVFVSLLDAITRGHRIHYPTSWCSLETGSF